MGGACASRHKERPWLPLVRVAPPPRAAPLLLWDDAEVEKEEHARREHAIHTTSSLEARRRLAPAQRWAIPSAVRRARHSPSGFDHRSGSDQDCGRGCTRYLPCRTAWTAARPGLKRRTAPLADLGQRPVDAPADAVRCHLRDPPAQDGLRGQRELDVDDHPLVRRGLGLPARSPHVSAYGSRSASARCLASETAATRCSSPPQPARARTTTISHRRTTGTYPFRP
jgi:hypothetical protein